MLHQQRTDQKSDLYLLTRLIETLKDLKILHQSFRFRIKLADFDIDAKADVAALILDWFQVNESGKMPYFNKPCLRPIITYSIFLSLIVSFWFFHCFAFKYFLFERYLAKISVHEHLQNCIKEILIGKLICLCIMICFSDSQRSRRSSEAFPSRLHGENESGMLKLEIL